MKIQAIRLLCPLALTGVLLGAAELSSAQKVLQKLSGVPRKTAVKRLGKVGPDLKLIGRWSMPIDPHGLMDGPPWYPIFDCFEASLSSPFGPSEVYAPTTYNSSLSDPPDNRYWYGAGYVNPFVANDMNVATGYIGASANRVQVAYGFSLDGASSGSEQLYVIIRTYENFANTQAGLGTNISFSGPLNSTANPANGEVFDLGVVNYNNSGYNYITQLLSAGQHLKMPDDGATGSGAYVVIFAKTYNPTTGAYTPSTVAQPMLWVTKPNSNPSSQNENQWDDDSPTDGVHFTNPPNTVYEFYDYSSGSLFGTGSPPFGAMVAFYSDTVPGYRPNSYTVTEGVEGAPLSTVSKLYKSDNVRLSIQNDELTPNPTFEATSNSFYKTPSGFAFTYESSCSRTDMIENVQFYSYASSQFVSNTAWNRIPTISDSVRTVTVTTSPANYVNASTGDMRVRISQVPVAEVDGFDGWGGAFDFIRWDITP